MRKKRNLFKELNVKNNYNNDKFSFDIDISKITKTVNNNLNSVYEERKIYMKHKLFKGAIFSAVITSLLATSVFAISPTGQKLIGNIISYFNNSDAVEITDVKELAKYNNTINVSDTKGNYTLTLDNVATDDNFIHVFYTITSEKPLKIENKSIFFDPEYEETSFIFHLGCRLNGKLIGMGQNNHNIDDGYYTNGNKTYKGVKKYNISSMDIPDNFKIELYSPIEVLKHDLKKENHFYSDDYKITDEDKKNILYVSADIDKSKTNVNTITKNIHKELPFSNSELEKVIFSPFGNQLVIKNKISDHSENSIAMIDNFVLYDEKGTSLDVLNTDLSLNTEKETRNSFEFLKANLETKQLKIVPFHWKDVKTIDAVENKIGKYPITYEVSNYGKVVVTDIRISDGKIEIDYYKDGFVTYDPGFQLLDDNGNNAEPGGKLGNVLNIRVNYDTNSYTAVYEYEAYDDKGMKIPADNNVSAENLKKSFTTLSVFKNYIELDYDNAVTVDLE